MTPPETIDIHRAANEIDVVELDDPAWNQGSNFRVSRYWSGDHAVASRHFTVNLLWSAIALYVRFEANQEEPLVIEHEPKFDSKTIGLWDRDVCEVFIAPDRDEPSKYFEFEVAPTGEWLDLEIDMTSGSRQTNVEYRSGMSAAAQIFGDRVVETIRVPFTAFGKAPQPGEIWLGNFFRCVGKGPDRGYLAWHPTETRIPNFHVPQKFGRLRFVD